MPRFTGYGALRWLVHCALALSLLGGTPAHAAAPLIWAFGDSLTAGLGLPPRDGFTNQLERALHDAGIPATVKNGGISGDTAAQGRARLLWGLRGLGVKPDLVIVELGANDMLRGLPPAQAETNLDLILAELKRRDIRVLVAGMKASPNLGQDYVRAFDAMYPKLARRYHATLYPFFLDGVLGKPALIQADGIHPNAQGVSIVVGRMLPVVRSELRSGAASGR
jgi:acyl-CoA thioesterase-1